MREFVSGWRRKIGCAALVIAVAFAVGWMRSIVLADFIGSPSGATTYFVVSHGGLLELQRLMPTTQYSPVATQGKSCFATATPLRWMAEPPPVIWGSIRLDWYDGHFGLRVGTVDVAWKEYEVEWQRGCGQLLLVSGNDGSRRAFKVVVPYWTVTIPLTLLSAYLILWKPGAREVAASPEA